MSMKKFSVPTSMFILFLLWFPAIPTHAHKVYLFAWVEGDTVHIDSYYPNKKKVSGGLIKVFDSSDDQLLLSGKTDEGGAFSFKIPKKADLRIVLEAGMGHRTEFLLPGSEFSQQDTQPQGSGEGKVKDESPKSFHEIQVDPHQLRKIIETALEKKLAPIERKLAHLEKEERPGLTEIIGGIGYIIGLMGLALYFKSRKKG
jgi:nickel transport protein